MEDRGTIGSRIRATRLARGLTLEQASERVPCSISHLNDIEHGRRNPSAEMVGKIAQALDASADYLLGLTNGQNQIARPPEGDELTTAAHASPPPEGVDLEEWQRRARARLEELLDDVRRDWEETQRKRRGR